MCGGTHVEHASRIGTVALTSEGSVGLNAASLVRKLLGGRGGGSPEPAQGGGRAADRLVDPLAELPRAITAR
ncbi:hypothetical protein ACFU6J_04020 [Streptomyces gardneri]|uniref:hypothetical protein n=1 Tax=Streptomyces gardneri TaxID=66892 RepID=UPI0036A96A1D